MLQIFVINMFVSDQQHSKICWDPRKIISLLASDERALSQLCTALFNISNLLASPSDVQFGISEKGEKIVRLKLGPRSSA